MAIGARRQRRGLLLVLLAAKTVTTSQHQSSSMSADIDCIGSKNRSRDPISGMCRLGQLAAGTGHNRCQAQQHRFVDVVAVSTAECMLFWILTVIVNPAQALGMEMVNGSSCAGAFVTNSRQPAPSTTFCVTHYIALRWKKVICVIHFPLKNY